MSRFRDLLSIAVGGILARKVRTLLIMLGPVVGVAAMVGAVGLTESAKGDLKARLAELEGQVGTLRAERDVVAARVRPDVMRRYNGIVMKKGLAVVPVRRGGVCGGCNMAIPPQLFNILQRMNSIETCPTCNRIIYVEAIKAEAELERGESKTET